MADSRKLHKHKERFMTICEAQEFRWNDFTENFRFLGQAIVIHKKRLCELRIAR